jgi:acetoin utilization deacetylase AcuC-like enzyme
MFAIVRPPGHHSYGNVPQGYCIFNNVAIAAKLAVERLGLERVLIVDFDIHPPNGTFNSERPHSFGIVAQSHAWSCMASHSRHELRCVRQDKYHKRMIMVGNTFF